MKFSEKIIQARKAKALTQEDLAEAVGVSRQAVSKWETEEAKPDLDKLVAICSVLDLSMDYLCLDKAPAIAAEPATEPVKNDAKRYLWIGLCIGLVAALLIGLLAMGLWGRTDEPTEPELQQTSTPAATSTTAPDYSPLLSSLAVATADRRTVGLRTFRITFVPSMDVPGMTVQIAVRNNKIGNTYYLEPTKLGNSYILDYQRPESAFDLDFIAVCSIGEVKVQFPLYNVESHNDATLYGWKDLWKD